MSFIAAILGTLALVRFAAAQESPKAATTAPPAPAATAVAPAATAVAPASTAAATAVTRPHAGTASRRRKTDHIVLGTTTVTGNRELPKVMYIVPWKKSAIGDMGGKPPDSLMDEVLAPVDRDVFRREVAYYQALAVAAPRAGAPPAAPARQREK
ncbi:MAG TPA: hypothetical protein VMV25_12025 [Steroidobacteraceae bacterium]|nr:hypothetical protein [Steroidobacteraceae bacterium]